MPQEPGQGGGERQVQHRGLAQAKLPLRPGQAQGLLRQLPLQRAQLVHDDGVHQDLRPDQEASARGQEPRLRRHTHPRPDEPAQTHRSAHQIQSRRAQHPGRHRRRLAGSRYPRGGRGDQLRRPAKQ